MRVISQSNNVTEKPEPNRRLITPKAFYERFSTAHKIAIQEPTVTATTKALFVEYQFKEKHNMPIDLDSEILIGGFANLVTPEDIMTQEEADYIRRDCEDHELHSDAYL